MVFQMIRIQRLKRQMGELFQQGRYADGIAVAKEALEVARRAYGHDNLPYADGLNNLAEFYRHAGDYKQAGPLYPQALDILARSVGKGHQLYAIVLNNSAELQRQTGHYAEAESLYRECAAILAQTTGKSNSNYATCVGNLAFACKLLGRYDEAEKFYHEALDLRRRLLGDDHPEVATTLHNLAGLYRERGEFQRAEKLYGEALDAKQRVYGEQHPSFATTQNMLAALHEETGRYAEAEAGYKRSLEIKRTTVGERHPSFAVTLHNLAGLYQKKGDYGRAIALTQEGVEIAKATMGEEHPYYATALNNLAAMHFSTGDYGQSLQLHLRAGDIRRRQLGVDHQEYADSLNNQGAVHHAMGNYKQAAELWERALSIKRKALGETHHHVATALTNLASLYGKIADFDKSLDLYRQALELRRRAFGERHPDVAVSLNNLATAYRECHADDKAEALYLQAIDLHRDAVGRDDSNSLNNLADLYASQGEYEKALPLFKRALEIIRERVGENHPDYATCLANLGLAYDGMGMHGEARDLLERAKELRAMALGESHPQYTASLHLLAGLYAITRQIDKALPLMEQAMRAEDRTLGEVFCVGSERQRIQFLNSIRTKTDAYLSLVWKHFGDDEAAIRKAFEHVLARKALGAEALAIQRETFFSQSDDRLAGQVKQLRMLRMQIARKTLAGVGAENAESHFATLRAWESQREELEQSLAKESPELGLERQLRSSGRAEVAGRLPVDSLLVEFARFDVFDFDSAAPSKSERRWKPARYIAFLLFPENAEDVRMVDLGEAEGIDSLIAKFRQGIQAAGARDLGSRSQADPRLAPRGEIGGTLRSRIIDPLEAEIGKRRRLYLAPDGDLCHLPFEALPTPGGGNLIDEYAISYLTVGRDVVRFTNAVCHRRSAPIVLCDPDFDLNAESTTPNDSPTTPGRQSREFGLRNLAFSRLPGTRDEGQRIANMLGVAPWIDAEALEGRLKRCDSPGIMHLATHGFFFEDQRHVPRGDWLDAVRLEQPQERLSGIRLENPLLRSGLALAGANRWLNNYLLPEDAEDGLLTAEDVTGLELSNTELVVLSACETGLGEIRVGEGVLGLRRAFVLAGASTLVMSLWKVPDEQTSELMVDFYRRLLGGEGRAEALRNAQLAMKEKYPDPLYWGAFICQGDPSPLPEIN